MSLFSYLCLVSLIFSTGFLHLSSSSSSSVEDTLRSYGLPPGLFPLSVESFFIDSTGQFTVHLNHSCYAQFESQLHYAFNISGSLTSGLLNSLSGVLAQELFLWFPVTRIRVDIPTSGLIYFDVGGVSKQFSLSLFESPPDCVAGSPPEETIQLPEILARSEPQNGPGKLGNEVDGRGTVRAVS